MNKLTFDASQLRNFVRYLLRIQLRPMEPCRFRSPRNIYAVTNRMKILYGKDSNEIRTCVTLKPPYDIFSREFANAAQFSIVQVIPPARHAPHVFNVCMHVSLSNIRLRLFNIRSAMHGHTMTGRCALYFHGNQLSCTCT